MVATVVAVGPCGLEQKLLESDATAEAFRRSLQRLVVVELFDRAVLGGEHASRFEHVAAQCVVHRVDGRSLGPRCAQHLQLALVGGPALCDGLLLDLRKFARTDTPHCRQPLRLDERLRTQFGDGVNRTGRTGRFGHCSLPRLRRGIIRRSLGRRHFGLRGRGFVHIDALLLRRNRRARIAVCAEIHEADLAQHCAPSDKKGAVDDPRIDRDRLAGPDEVGLRDPGADRCLPGKSPLAAGDDLSRRLRVSRDDALGDQPTRLDCDPLGVPHAGVHAVPEPNRAPLRRDGHALEVHDHRVPPALDAHGLAGVRDHREPRDRFAVALSRQRYQRDVAGLAAQLEPVGHRLSVRLPGGRLRLP